MPVYNVAPYLRDAMDSVTGQTLREIEIICVDDGSTDESVEILKQYAAADARITILAQQNLNAGTARNAGLAVARGKYMIFLDSDDFFEPEMLESLYATARNTNADITVCGADIYRHNTGEFVSALFLLNPDKPPDRPVFSPDDLGENLFTFTAPAVWNKLYRSDFIKSHNLHFQSMWSCNDIGFGFSAIALAKRISVVPETLMHYRRNTTTCISHSRGKQAANILHAYYFIRANLTHSGAPKSHFELLDTVFKEKIRWERSQCTLKDAKKFKRQAKHILNKDFRKFKHCFDPKHSVRYYLFCIPFLKIEEM